VGYEDVGERRDMRPNLGGLVFGCGFLRGRIPCRVYSRVLEYPGTMLRGVWTAVDVQCAAIYCYLCRGLLEIGKAWVLGRDVLAYLGISKKGIVVA
jgi:hypothetical protein